MGLQHQIVLCLAVTRGGGEGVAMPACLPVKVSDLLSMG